VARSLHDAFRQYPHADLSALFLSLDKHTQRQFAGFAALQIGMALHPEPDEADDDEADDDEAAC
jgi:hypothetical protein